MPDELRTQLLSFFDVAIDRIREHASYGPQLERAARDQRELVLNYHTHGPAHGYCASICTVDGAVPLIGLPGELTELVHLRGIAKELAACEPMMDAFAERLVERYGLLHRPVTWVDGKPRVA
jgi:hypothetical protein